MLAAKEGKGTLVKCKNASNRKESKLAECKNTWNYESKKVSETT